MGGVGRSAGAEEVAGRCRGRRRRHGRAPEAAENGGLVTAAAPVSLEEPGLAPRLCTAKPEGAKCAGGDGWGGWVVEAGLAAAAKASAVARARG